ncbi:MAG: Lrp/AsnC family transcriptional regulator, partial [Deltaproteobacteria bacterium]|nr:Lrp/AsnC family transcriptional regulator [Deltaproteobacteria bacterium]
MGISEKEKAILSAVELNARRPLAQLKQRLPYREHTLRYFMQKFEVQNGIYPKPVINFRQLGYAEFSIYFTPSSRTTMRHEGPFKRLGRFGQIRSLTSLAGDYEYQLICQVPGPQDVVSFLERMCVTLQNTFTARAVVMRLAETHLGRKYLAKPQPKLPAIVVRKMDREYLAEQLDRRIINALIQKPF